MYNMLKLRDIYIKSFDDYINNYKGLYDPHSYFKFFISKNFKYSFIDYGGNSNLVNTPLGYCIE